MAATVRIAYGSGAPTGNEPTTLTNVDSEGGGSGFRFNLDNSNTGTTSIQIPTATGTNFSYAVYLLLRVTVTDAATTISNRKIWSNGAPATGLALWYKDGGTTYTQPAAAADTASGSNGATPTGYTAMPTSSGAAATWHAAGVAASSAGRNGNFLMVALGVSNNYAGGGNPNATAPDIKVSFDEA